MDTPTVLKLLEEVRQYGFWAVVVLVVAAFLYFVKPTDVKEWLKLLSEVLYFVCGLFPKLKATVVDRWRTKHSIESSIESVSEIINKEASEVFPHTLKIEWVNRDSVGAHIHNGRVIVSLKPSEHHGRNLVIIALCYVKEGFLPTGQTLLDETLTTACEYIIVGKILRTDTRTNAYRYFIEEDLERAKKADSRLGADLERLDQLDGKGCLTRIFMRQIEYAAKSGFAISQVRNIQAEIREFSLYLFNVVTKTLGQDVALDFSRSTVRAGMVLVGRSEILDSYGTDAYVRRITI